MKVTAMLLIIIAMTMMKITLIVQVFDNNNDANTGNDSKNYNNNDNCYY